MNVRSEKLSTSPVRSVVNEKAACTALLGDREIVQLTDSVQVWEVKVYPTFGPNRNIKMWTLMAEKGRNEK